MFSYSSALLVVASQSVYSGTPSSIFTDNLPPPDSPYPQTQASLVEFLHLYGFLKSKRVTEIMLNVDRKYYVPHGFYEEYPFGIGYGSTINIAPVHAFVLQSLEDHLKEGCKVMDVGSGSGYLTVCLSLMVGKTGHVVGLEHISEIVNISTMNVMADKPWLLTEGRLKFVETDGRLGYPEEGPYDVINVGAAVKEIPKILVKQLKEGGRMVIPMNVDANRQKMMLLDKEADGSIRTIMKERKLKKSQVEDLTTKEDQWPLTDDEKKIIEEILERQKLLTTPKPYNF